MRNANNNINTNANMNVQEMKKIQKREDRIAKKEIGAQMTTHPMTLSQFLR